jgi:hypothetical protein
MMDYLVHNLFSTQDGVVWLAVKWVFIVLAAGFIGQFGKSFASYLMGRARLHKTGSPQSAPGQGLKEDAPQRAAPREEPSSGRMERAPAPPAAEPADRLKAEKKEWKAREKRRKKELKNLKMFIT